MQAHEDKLSRRCQFALYRASRGLDRAINRVERSADACMDDIEAQCGDAERIGQCLVQKSGSLSQPGQMEDVAEAIRRDSAKWLDVDQALWHQARLSRKYAPPAGISPCSPPTSGLQAQAPA